METETMSDAVETRLLELLEKINGQLGDISTGLALQTKMLEVHTASDTANFASLSSAMTDLKAEMKVIQLARAEEAGEKRANEATSRNLALRWGGGIAAGLVALSEAVRQWWPTGQ
jgi:hypothetical protein